MHTRPLARAVAGGGGGGRVPLHANGAQLVASGTTQRPLSLHVAGAV